MEIQLGLSKQARSEIAELLSDFLSNTYALYLKTQNFHYNVTGPEFFSLHLLFEKQYEELSEAVDEIAERIRTLGAFVDATLSGFAKRATLLQEIDRMDSAQSMLKELTLANEALARAGRPLIPHFQELGDEVSADLLIKRLTFHEKAAWMLRSHLRSSV